jgi:hypothetical protein
MPTFTLSEPSRWIAGIMLISIVTIEFGGTYLLRIVAGDVEVTQFQAAYARAGHAHAGVLVTLGLVGVLLADAAGLSGVAGYISRLGTPLAAVLIPAGFFLSSLGSGATSPNGLVVLIWLGAGSLAIGVLTLGIGLLRRPAHARAPQKEFLADADR